VILDIEHRVCARTILDHLSILAAGGSKLTASKAVGLDLEAGAKCVLLLLV
jgi:hypothetical protein